MNLPNKLTVSRFLLTGAFLWAMFSRSPVNDTLALVFFCVASITDFLDGKIARSRLGFRTLMNVIALDATLVKGSHGRLTDDPAQGPVFISGDPALVPPGEVSATEVKELLLKQLFGADRSDRTEHGMARAR